MIKNIPYHIQRAKEKFNTLPEEITLFDCISEVKRLVRIGDGSRHIGKDKKNLNGKFEFWADKTGLVWFRQLITDRPFPLLDADLQLVTIKN